MNQTIMTTDQTYKEKLSSAITTHNDSLQKNLSTILYMIGDSSKTPSEDNLMNMLIGAMELQQANTYDLLEKVNIDENSIARC